MIKKNATNIYILLIAAFLVVISSAQAYYNVGDGRDGNLTVAAADTVINNYTYATAAITAGARNFTLASCANITNGSDIILMDMSGTEIGRWEQHFKVNINASCFVSFVTNESVNWTTSTKVQVINVPNYVNVTIPTGMNMIAPAVDVTTGQGGVVAFRFSGYLDTQGGIMVNGKGYVGGAGSGSCSGTGTQGTSYTGSGSASTSANGAGGGGAHVLNNNCAVDGGGGAGQGGNGGQGFTAGSCAGVTLGSGGTNQVTNGSTFSHLGIGGGGGGGAACGRTATTGATGGGAIILFGNTSLNLRASAQGNPASTTGDGGGEGGIGGSGSIYLDIHNVTFTSVNASQPEVGDQGDGGAGVIAGHFNITSGTTTPTLVSYGNFQPGTAPPYVNPIRNVIFRSGSRIIFRSGGFKLIFRHGST